VCELIPGELFSWVVHSAAPCVYAASAEILKRQLWTAQASRLVKRNARNLNVINGADREGGFGRDCKRIGEPLRVEGAHLCDFFQIHVGKHQLLVVGIDHGGPVCSKKLAIRGMIPQEAHYK
jgi:hypothetical protein